MRLTETVSHYFTVYNALGKSFVLWKILPNKRKEKYTLGRDSLIWSLDLLKGLVKLGLGLTF